MTSANVSERCKRPRNDLMLVSNHMSRCVNEPRPLTDSLRVVFCIIYTIHYSKGTTTLLRKTDSANKEVHQQKRKNKQSSNRGKEEKRDAYMYISRPTEKSHSNCTASIEYHILGGEDSSRESHYG